jgi:hypothetical protein
MRSAASSVIIACQHTPTTVDLIGTLSFPASDDAAFITATICVDGG